MENKKKYYYWLDPIRAFAACLVLLVHSRAAVFVIYPELNNESKNILSALFYFICNQGHLAVVLFFILSGFLVGGGTIKKLSNSASYPISPINFGINRFFRIIPALFFAVLFAYIINCVIGKDQNVITLIGNLFGLQGIFVDSICGVFWTLSYEIWFYILLFSLICLVNKKIESRVSWTGSIILILSLIVFLKLDTYWLFIILCGIISYQLMNVKLNKIQIIITSIIALFSFIIFTFSRESHISILSILANTSVYMSSLLLFSGASAILISQIVHLKPKNKLLIKIHFIGDKLSVFSYSLFLTHFPILSLYNYIFNRFSEINAFSILIFLAINLFCYLFAYGFYLLIERNSYKIQSWIEPYLLKIRSQIAF